jgi:hypothetical protein
MTPGKTPTNSGHPCESAGIATAQNPIATNSHDTERLTMTGPYR